jgi:hypothetical protein
MTKAISQHTTQENKPPHIRITRRWVEEAGFPIGTQVDVEVFHSIPTSKEMPIN